MILKLNNTYIPALLDALETAKTEYRIQVLLNESKNPKVADANSKLEKEIDYIINLVKSSKSHN